MLAGADSWVRVDCRYGCALVPGWGLADYSGWGGLIDGGWSGGWFLGTARCFLVCLIGGCVLPGSGWIACLLDSGAGRAGGGWRTPSRCWRGRVLSCGWLLLGSGWRWLVWRGSGVGWLDCSGRVCSCFPVGSVGGCWLLVWLPVPVGGWHSPACGSMFPRGGDSPGWWLVVGGWWLAVGCSLDGWRAFSPRGCCWIAVGMVLVGWFLHGAVSLVGGWHSPRRVVGSARFRCGVVGSPGSPVGWVVAIGSPGLAAVGGWWLVVAGGEGNAETSGSWVVVLSRLSVRWLALSRAGGVIGCCSQAPMVGGVFPVWRWQARSCAGGVVLAWARCIRF